MSQHMDALDKGNRLRMAQTAILREVRSSSCIDGRDRAAAILRNPSTVESTIRVDRLLRSIKRVGDERATKIARRAGLEYRLLRRIGKLTERERKQLASSVIATFTGIVK